MRVAISMAALLLLSSCATAQTSPLRVSRGEGDGHFIGPIPVVPTAWRDAPALIEQTRSEAIEVAITVSESGEVVSAVGLSGPAEYLAEAEVVASSLRFEPFERDGRPIGATFEFRMRARPLDYTGPADRSFPASPDPSSIKMRLQRTQCFGTCAAYSVDISGDGAVTYRGEAYVLVPGEHHWDIPRENVRALIEIFRRADYFNLGGYYEINVTDLPVAVTGLRIGPRRKFVLDYGGSFAEAIGLTAGPGEMAGSVPPRAVIEIEDAIVRLSGVEAWVVGNDETIEALRAAGWDFRSPESGAALGFALGACNIGLAEAFLAEGAPVSVAEHEAGPRSLPIARAARCGDLDLVHTLIEKGALVGADAANAFLGASVERGLSDLTSLALMYVRDLDRAPGSDEPFLLAAARGDPYSGMPRAEDSDPARVVALLLEAGADPGQTDDNGLTPLHGAANGDVVLLLVNAGVSPNARDDFGRTPLEAAYNENTALSLIAAGAEIPADPVRLQALIETAERYGWESLLPDLKQRAAPAN